MGRIRSRQRWICTPPPAARLGPDRERASSRRESPSRWRWCGLGGVSPGKTRGGTMAMAGGRRDVTLRQHGARSDGGDNRLPAEGTAAVGQLADNSRGWLGARAEARPAMAATGEVTVARGRPRRCSQRRRGWLRREEARPAVAEVDAAGDEAGEACAITAWSAEAPASTARGESGGCQ